MATPVQTPVPAAVERPARWRRWRRRLGWLAVILLILGLAGGLGGVLYLDQLVEYGMRQLLRRYHLGNLELRVIAITPRHIVAGPLHLGPPDEGLSVDTVVIAHGDHHWGKPGIQAIRLHDLRVTLRQTATGWELPGLNELLAQLATLRPATASPAPASMDAAPADDPWDLLAQIPPTSVSALQVRLVTLAGQELLIPGRLRLGPDGVGRLKTHLELHPLGASLDLQATLSREANPPLAFELQVKGAAPSQLNPWIVALAPEAYRGLALTGLGDLSVSGSLDPATRRGQLVWTGQVGEFSVNWPALPPAWLAPLASAHPLLAAPKQACGSLRAHSVTATGSLANTGDGAWASKLSLTADGVSLASRWQGQQDFSIAAHAGVAIGLTVITADDFQVVSLRDVTLDLRQPEVRFDTADGLAFASLALAESSLKAEGHRDDTGAGQLSLTARVAGGAAKWRLAETSKLPWWPAPATNGQASFSVEQVALTGTRAPGQPDQAALAWQLKYETSLTVDLPAPLGQWTLALADQTSGSAQATGSTLAALQLKLKPSLALAGQLADPIGAVALKLTELDTTVTLQDNRWQMQSALAGLKASAAGLEAAGAGQPLAVNWAWQGWQPWLGQGTIKAQGAAVAVPHGELGPWEIALDLRGAAAWQELAGTVALTLGASRYQELALPAGLGLKLLLGEGRAAFDLQAVALNHGVELAAELALQGEVNLPTATEPVQARGRLQVLKLRQGELTLSPTQAVWRATLEQVAVTLGPLSSPERPGLLLRESQFSAQRVGELWQASGESQLDVKLPEMLPWLPAVAGVGGSFAGRLAAKGSYDPRDGAVGYTAELQVQGSELSLTQPLKAGAELLSVLHLEGTLAAATLAGIVQIQGLHADHAAGELLPGELTVRLTALDLPLAKLQQAAKAGTFKLATLPDMLQAKGQVSANLPEWAVTGWARGGLAVELPFDWRGRDGFAETQGSIQLKDSRVRYLKLATPAWPVTLRGHQASLALSVASDPAAVSLSFTPTLEWREGLKALGKYQVSIPELGPAASLLGDLFPDLPVGLPKLAGSLQITGQAGWGATRGLYGDLALALREGALSLTQPAVSVTKIELDLSLNRLWPPRSGAMQRLRFGEAAAVGMPLESGLLEFQIESLESILIERLELGWCGGLLAAHALRLNPSKPDFDLTLYADNIQVGQVFGLFQGFKGTGEGVLHGKLPVSYKDGKVAYRNGFLYSTPGQPGHIRLQEWALLDTLPEAVSQIGDFKRALKNFQYDFFTMDLAGEGEETSIKLRLYGRDASAPAQPYDFKTNIRGHLKEVINASIGFNRIRGLFQ